MAFAQQQKRPRYNRYIPSSSSEESSDILQQQEQQQEEQLVFQRAYRNNSLTVSDSDTDWHVISSTLPSSQSSNITSPVLFASSSESSVRLVSDISEDESIGPQQQQQQQTNTFLPSHDGTGTFLNELDRPSSLANETQEFANVVNRLAFHFATTDEEDDDDEAKSKESIVDFTLPFGGIRPPSFIPKNINPPSFVATVAGLNSQEITNGVLSGENIILSDGGNRSVTKDHTNMRRHIKESNSGISIHHSGSPGISAAILSIIWDNLKRLRDHLLENDTNTVETLSNLMSEAVLEGCVPFSSHLHMEFDNPLRSSTSYSFFEGNIAI